MADDVKIVTLKSSYNNKEIYPKTSIAGVDGLEAYIAKKLENIELDDTKITELLDKQLSDWKEELITDVSKQLDGVAHTWRQDEDPEIEWIDKSTKSEHVGDLWYCTGDIKDGDTILFFEGETYRYEYDTKNKKYGWEIFSISVDVWNEIDSKTTIYIKQPIDKDYKVNDLWIIGTDYRPIVLDASNNEIEATIGTLLICVTNRNADNPDNIYRNEDWKVQSIFVTPDEAVKLVTENKNFKDLVTEVIHETQTDQSIETFISVENPATEWENNGVQSEHIGDLWVKLKTDNTIENTFMYVYNSNGSEGNSDSDITTQHKYDWIEYPVPEGLLDLVDGKCRLFMPAYDPSVSSWIGIPKLCNACDLMIIPENYKNGTEIIEFVDDNGKKCEFAPGELVIAESPSTGKFLFSNWSQKLHYTNQAQYNEFINKYSQYIDIIKTQIDIKGEMWYQTEDPSSNWQDDPVDDVWDSSTDYKKNHVGDIWFNPEADTDKIQIFEETSDSSNPYNWVEEKSIPAEIFDRFDGYGAVYVTPPTSANENDILILKDDIIVIDPSGNTNTKKQGTIYKCTNDFTDLNSNTAEYWNNWEEVIATVTRGEFSDFVVDYNDFKGKIGADNLAQIWRQSEDPSNEWTDVSIKSEHVGDIWFNTSTDENDKTCNKSAIYATHKNGDNIEYYWDWNYAIPEILSDKLDNKSQIFTSCPSTSMYYARDLWIVDAGDGSLYCTSTNTVTNESSGNTLINVGTILTAVENKDSSFKYSDWEKKIQYVDSTTWGSEFNNFKNEIENQIDQSVTTWKYESAPTLSGDNMSRPWNDSKMDKEHLCDLWIDTSANMSYMLGLDENNNYKWVEYDLPDVVEKKITDRARIWMPDSSTAVPFVDITIIKKGDVIMPTAEIKYDDTTYFPNKVYTWDGSKFIEIEYTDDSELDNFKDDLADGNVITKGEKAEYVRRIKQITNQENSNNFTPEYIGDFLTGSFHDTYLKLISASQYDKADNLKNLLINLLKLVAPSADNSIFDDTKDWNYETEDKDYNHQREIENAFKAYSDYEAICNSNISSDLNYLKNIFNNDVDESGVTLSNLLAVKDNEAKNVVAGIYGGNIEDLDNNGFKDDELGTLMMFAGANDINNVSNANYKIYEDGTIICGAGKILLKSDGSGQLANGNIYWDSEGYLYLRCPINQKTETVNTLVGLMDDPGIPSADCSLCGYFYINPQMVTSSDYNENMVAWFKIKNLGSKYNNIDFYVTPQDEYEYKSNQVFVPYIGFSNYYGSRLINSNLKVQMKYSDATSGDLYPVRLIKISNVTPTRNAKLLFSIKKSNNNYIIIIDDTATININNMTNIGYVADIEFDLK